MIYFNIKTAQGVETVDSLNKKDFTTIKEFVHERRRLLAEYNIAFSGGVYLSSRATKEYKNR